MIICVRAVSPLRAPLSEEVAAELLAIVPRVRVESRGVVWADGRGLGEADGAARAAGRLVRRLGAWSREAGGPASSGDDGGGWYAGVAAVPVVAYVAAGHATLVAESGGVNGTATVAAGELPSRVQMVTGEGDAFLAPLPLAVLEPEARLHELLDGVGVTRCGELAALPREAVEVRFGGDAVGLWRWSRGVDGRRPFGAPATERAHASLDFVDYVITDPERLLFTTNALLTLLCAALEVRGEHARGVRLTLLLAGGGEWRRVLRAARPTANRATWLRLARGVFERLTVPDAVAGVAVAVEMTEAAGTEQGDLFDPGFGTAAAVDAAVGRLRETYTGALGVLRADRHPVIEGRTRFVEGLNGRARARYGTGTGSGTGLNGRARARDGTGSGTGSGSGSNGRARARARAGTGLTLQVLEEPRRVRVETAGRRDHELPVRYHDRGWQRLVTAAGPDRVSGGQWEACYAREYYRAITEDGRLVWLFRDGRTGVWYLHGWWD